MGCPRFPQKGEKGQGYPQSIQDDSTKECGRKVSLYKGTFLPLVKGFLTLQRTAWGKFYGALPQTPLAYSVLCFAKPPLVGGASSPLPYEKSEAKTFICLWRIYPNFLLKKRSFFVWGSRGIIPLVGVSGTKSLS